MGRKVMNLVGKKFGKLTVKKEIEERQNNAVQWLCECECGNETIVTGNNLKSGNIKSCGECNHRNLVGKRFGNWIVIEKAPNGKNYQTRWLCECQCELHTRKIIAEQNLIKGLSNGCGCLMLKDLTGEIFGNLLVLKRLPNTENGYVQYQCQCLCENQTIVNVLATNLRNGNTQSCGCLKKDCNLFEAREEYYIGYTKDNQEFLISKEDYPTVSKHCWCIDNRGYFCTNIGNEMVSLHRFILKVKNNEIVDHINRDKNDNTRENLRICTNSQNGMNSKKKINNTSGIIGVSWSKGNNCWRARIQKDGKEFLLGYYKNFDDAVLSRLKGEKEYYKEFAPQRHLFEQYNI